MATAVQSVVAAVPPLAGAGPGLRGMLVTTQNMGDHSVLLIASDENLANKVQGLIRKIFIRGNE